MVEYPMAMTAADSSTLCIVLFGGSGDLAMRRILPALHTLWLMGGLPRQTAIVGLATTALCEQSYREQCKTILSALPSPRSEQEHSSADFLDRLFYIQGDINDAGVYKLLHQRYFADPSVNGLFYLACAPDLFGSAARHLAEERLAGLHATGRQATGQLAGQQLAGQQAAGQHAAGQLAEERPVGQPTDKQRAVCPSGSGTGFRRIMIEKPFGSDLWAARSLNQLLHQHYAEADIFRVDHYLGKDAVQNLIYFRFTNTIFEPLWNRKYIDRVEIVLSEDSGIAGRGDYYDKAGAGRDMLQNHLMQLFCLTAMETPENLSAQAVREEKVKLLKQCRIPEHSSTLPAWIRGQYRGYRHEALVAADSGTETFVALKLYVDNWRWQGVPFILQTGKALNRRYGEINIHFRQCPMEIPGAAPGANRLVLRIQPEEGVAMRFNTRAPGGMEAEHEELVGTLRDSAKAAPGPYERLLADALRGDSTLFIRFDETEEAWNLLDGLIRGWSAENALAPLHYECGSAGPDISALYRHHPQWDYQYGSA